jgi:type II secretory pathway predicted ATPase ExeA
VRLRKLWRAAAYLIQWHMLQRRTLKVTRLLVEKTENDEDEIYILLWTQGKLVELTVLLLAARKISV